METSSHYYYSSPRALAMVLALVSSLMLLPLYRRSESRLEARWSSGGLVLPVVVAGLIVAIKTTTSSSNYYNYSVQRGTANNFQSYPVDNYSGGLEFRIGSSSWGLAGILIMLIFVISWQASVQHFFWR